MYSDEIVATFDSGGHRLRLHHAEDRPSLAADGHVELDELRKLASHALTRFAKLDPGRLGAIDQLSAASIIVMLDASGI